MARTAPPRLMLGRPLDGRGRGVCWIPVCAGPSLGRLLPGAGKRPAAQVGLSHGRQRQLASVGENVSFFLLSRMFWEFRRGDWRKCLLERGLWNLALWAVLDLTCFLAMGYDFFPGGCEKMGWPAGRRWGVAGWAGTAQERRSACFSAAGCDWERLGFWPLGGRRRPNIFLFASEVVEKNRGWRARFLSIFSRFWVFGGPQRVMYICSYNFRNLKISKALCLFRHPDPFPPAPSAAKAKSEYFPF